MGYTLTTFISFLLRTLEVTAEFTILSIFFNKKTKTFIFILCTILCAYFSQVIKNYIPYTLYWCIPTFLLCLTSKFLLNISWKQAITSILVLLTYLALMDCVLSALLLIIFDIAKFSDISKNENIYYLGSFIISVILFLIALLIKHWRLKKASSSLEVQKHASILTNIFATFILIIPNCFILLLYFDNKTLPLWIIFLNIFSLLLIAIISIINTNKAIKQAVSEERQIYQQNYITTLENLVDGLRTFKHDYSNTLATINGFIQLENWAGLKKFFSQIMDESKAISTLDKLNPNLIKNPTIFGLITAKYQVCIKRNIKMNFEILGTLDNLDINEFELSRILGIFLDNAIEAASGSKEKKINFLISELKTKTTIELSNSYSNENLKVADLFKKGISSKGKDRGLGLFKVNQILAKYPSISLETISSNNQFLQKLIIPKVL